MVRDVLSYPTLLHTLRWERPLFLPRPCVHVPDTSGPLRSSLLRQANKGVQRPTEDPVDHARRPLRSDRLRWTTQSHPLFTAALFCVRQVCHNPGRPRLVSPPRDGRPSAGSTGGSAPHLPGTPTPCRTFYSAPCFFGCFRR